MITGQAYPQYYPVYPNYQQYPQQMSAPPSQQAQSQIQNQILVWVQNEEEAMKFPLGAGQSIFLMNQNEPYLYMKSVDQLGKTTFIKNRLLDESGDKKPQIDLSDYIRREDLEALIPDIIQKEIEKRVSEMSFKATKAKKSLSED